MRQRWLRLPLALAALLLAGSACSSSKGGSTHATTTAGSSPVTTSTPSSSATSTTPPTTDGPNVPSTAPPTTTYVDPVTASDRDVIARAQAAVLVGPDAPTRDCVTELYLELLPQQITVGRSADYADFVRSDQNAALLSRSVDECEVPASAVTSLNQITGDVLFGRLFADTVWGREYLARAYAGPDLAAQLTKQLGHDPKIGVACARQQLQAASDIAAGEQAVINHCQSTA